MQFPKNKEPLRNLAVSYLLLRLYRRSVNVEIIFNPAHTAVILFIYYAIIHSVIISVFYLI
jgi:hypothetical protein